MEESVLFVSVLGSRFTVLHHLLFHGDVNESQRCITSFINERTADVQDIQRDQLGDFRIPRAEGDGRQKLELP